MKYDFHETMVHTARNRAELWRLALGILVAALVVFGLGQAMMSVVQLFTDDTGFDAFSSQMRLGNTPVGVMALLLSAGFLGIGALVAAQLVHRRPPLDMFGPLPLAIVQFLKVVVAIAGFFLLVTVLPPYQVFGPLQKGMMTGVWIALFPVSLVLLLLQTGAEELFFRGYLQQQLAARFDAPVIWMLAPSVLFAIAHYAPDTYGEAAGWVVVWAFVFAVLLADLTARAGSLGPAIAIHLLNNVWALLFVSIQGPMSSLALFKTGISPADTELLKVGLMLDLAMICVSWLVARVALRR